MGGFPGGLPGASWHCPLALHHQLQAVNVIIDERPILGYNLQGFIQEFVLGGGGNFVSGKQWV